MFIVLCLALSGLQHFTGNSMLPCKPISMVLLRIKLLQSNRQASYFSQNIDRLAIAHHFQMTIIFIAKIAYESKYPIAFELSFCFTCPLISPSITRASVAVAIIFKIISISPILEAVFLFEPFHFIHAHAEKSGRFIRIRMFEVFALLRKHEP